MRPHFYVTQKIVRAAYLASIGKIDLLKLGRIDIVRDWGWADDYVEAMALMLDKEYPSDYIISTGRSESLEYFLEKSFLEFNLDYKDFVIQDHNLFRPQDIKSSRGTPEKAKQHLGWVATHSIDDVIKKLCDSHQE